VFKLPGGSQVQNPLDSAPKVRAHPPKPTPFKGVERRAAGVAKGAAARAPQKLSAPVKSAPAAPAAAPATTTTASASSDGDWETF